MIKHTLPNKLSDLGELALKNLEQAIRSPRHRIDMDVYHLGAPGLTRCRVCLAGATMAFTLNTSPGAKYLPANFPDEVEGCLYAIDWLRKGRVDLGLNSLGIDASHMKDLNRQIVDFKDDNPAPFFQGMRKLIEDLRAEGY